MNDKLELSCPKCDNDNTVNLPAQLNCIHCGEILSEKTYIKKPRYSIPIFKSIFLGIVLGVIGTIALYFTFKVDRFTPKEEYLLINGCVNKSGNLSGRTLDEKLDICSDTYIQTLSEKKDFNSLYQKNIAITPTK